MKHLEDFTPGQSITVGTHRVTAQEIADFARAWDPQPLHLDDAASPFGAVIASGAHLMALTVRMLVGAADGQVALIAGVGWDRVRFRAPVRAGDAVTLTRRCLEARPSESKPGCGVVRNEILLTNQHDAVVLSYEDTLLVRRREPSILVISTAEPLS